MKTFNCALIGAFIFFAGTNLWAVPAGFNIQGRLTDANGVNKNGTFQIKFSVFKVETYGPALWEQTQTVPVQNGNFQVILQGDVLENAVKDLDAAYVEIKVGAEPPLVPRQPLLRSPFSPPEVTGKADVLIQSDSQNSGSGIIAMKTGSNDRLTILNNGNVGIGTTGPAGKLHVAALGDAIVIRPATMETGDVSKLVFSDPDGATGPMMIEYKDDGTPDLAIMGGNVGIGTMSTFTGPKGQTAKLNVAGAINFNPIGHTVMMTDTPGYLEYYIDGNYWGVSIWASSKHFKTDITELELDSGMIYDLRPVSFNWIAKRGGKRDFGLIAEEVEKILPLLIKCSGISMFLTQRRKGAKKQMHARFSLRALRLCARQDRPVVTFCGQRL
ncbi:MAG: tail fiber domain-containing protein, partial [Elusimicrobia bacterium]|nr:tail fiber domain-containing protein [Elusimicrobiota bacterium]